MEVHKHSSETYLSLGTNLGEKPQNLEEALDLLTSKLGPPFARSSFYESPSWGYESDHSFLNMCLGFRVDIDPFSLLTLALDAEKKLGRRPSSDSTKGYADRVIDIDVLFCGNRVIESASLVIPHPRLHERRFVLEPLAEIAPEFIHPVLKESVRDLLLNCKDPSRVRPV